MSPHNYEDLTKIIFNLSSDTRLISSSVLNVSILLQGEQPDEDEVYALIAALKRLYAFSW